MGAKPPSSPTDVDNFLFIIIFFKLFITKKHILKASEKDLALSGLIINSWILKPLFAWTPPLITFIKGYGNLKLFLIKKDLYKEIFLSFAESFLTAIDTANVVFAPIFLFCFVPSSLINI